MSLDTKICRVWKLMSTTKVTASALPSVTLKVNFSTVLGTVISCCSDLLNMISCGEERAAMERERERERTRGKRFTCLRLCMIDVIAAVVGFPCTHDNHSNQMYLGKKGRFQSAHV